MSEETTPPPAPPTRAELVAAVRAAWPAYAEQRFLSGPWPAVEDDGRTAALIDLAVDTVMAAYAGPDANAWFGR